MGRSANRQPAPHGITCSYARVFDTRPKAEEIFDSEDVDRDLFECRKECPIVVVEFRHRFENDGDRVAHDQGNQKHLDKAADASLGLAFLEDQISPLSRRIAMFFTRPGRHVSPVDLYFYVHIPARLSRIARSTHTANLPRSIFCATISFKTFKFKHKFGIATKSHSCRSVHEPPVACASVASCLYGDPRKGVADETSDNRRTVSSVPYNDGASSGFRRWRCLPASSGG